MSELPKYPCPCCGYLVFRELPGSYDICPICFWEDDIVQLQDPTFSGGANKPSLIDAQKNYREFGACEERLKPHARLPRPDEKRDPSWRPFDFEKDSKRIKANFEDDHVMQGLARMFLYYWKNTS